ncbi:MAG: hypothetical protein LH618_05315 [Saprospiraceae bacterium]|nr:hypothetical protein [Saprospiraceae bacterium]
MRQFEMHPGKGEGKGTMTVLGQKRSNPYAVETIRQAYKSLYEINLTATLQKIIIRCLLPARSLRILI